MSQIFLIVLAVAVAISASLVLILLDHLWRYKGKQGLDTTSATKKAIHEAGPEVSAWFEKPGQQLRA